ncbi:MAG: site-specific integrase [Lachnospiraceae bacterium]|nr:site-specific integrase [Lachnospiraceae bacterium]
MTDKRLQEIRIVSEERIEEYREIIIREEKRKQTIDKYVRDIHKLKDFLDGRELTKELFIQYKENLESCGEYTPVSINSFISAANSFCERMREWFERICRQVF